MEHEKGFFGQLFDFSFTGFIITKVVKLLYGLGIFFGLAGTIVVIVGAFTDSTAAGAVVLALSPLSLLLYIVAIRVLLEIVIALFRIAENVGDIARQGQEKSSQLS